MTSAGHGPPVALSQRQGIGCLALAAFALLGGVLCIALGVRCLLTSPVFDCIGLLTVFPAAFVAVGALSAAIGLRRFTRAGRAEAGPPAVVAFASGWQSVNGYGSAGPMLAAEHDVIHLPAANIDADQEVDGDDENA